VLVEMRRSRTHVAVVRDAEGRVCGLATLEDALEQLVGQIRGRVGLRPRRVTPPFGAERRDE